MVWSPRRWLFASGASRRIREYERALRGQPENFALRLKLAAALREAGREAEALTLYRSVVLAYHQQRRFAQAAAVCQGVLELAPGLDDIRALLAELTPALPTSLPAEPEATLVESATPRPGLPLPAPKPFSRPAATRSFFDEDARTTPSYRVGGATDLGVFRCLRSEAFEELRRRTAVRQFGAGELIVREGDAAEACYVIRSGMVSVFKRGPGSAENQIGRLGSGTLFGELALLGDHRRRASVRALEPCELHEIPRRLLRELTASFPEVGAELDRLFRERLMTAVLATGPAFAPLSEVERSLIMKRFTVRRVESGTTIIREGEHGGGLYVVVLGSVDITHRRDPQRAVLLATLGEGAYFGEMSLALGEVARVTATAVGPLELMQLSPKSFCELLSRVPELGGQGPMTGVPSELAACGILVGETGVV